MRNASQLRQEFEALTGPNFKRNRYEDFNTCGKSSQRNSGGGPRSSGGQPECRGSFSSHEHPGAHRKRTENPENGGFPWYRCEI